MTDVVFCFEVHQPCRLDPAHGSARPPGARGSDEPSWFDEALDRSVLERIASRCYLPMTALLRDLVERHDGRFRCALSITGTVLDQMRRWSPQCIDAFADLLDTGAVELVCETSHHSLAALVDQDDEFERQVARHRETVAELFGAVPTTFRNTELIVDERIAARVEALGFDTILAEGADRLLLGRQPFWPYRVRGCLRLELLLRCYPLSDDIGFRFSDRRWSEHPVTAARFARWLRAVPRNAAFVGLFLDYETFGEHQAARTGILEFMRALPTCVLADERHGFATPAQVAAAHDAIGELSIPEPVSWADAGRDLSAWLRNPMQRSAHDTLFAIAGDVRRAAALGRPDLLAAWRKLTTSDHFYYMASAAHSDAEVHQYFSPYDSPHDAYLIYMHVLDDLRTRVRAALAQTRSAPTIAPDAEPRGTTT